MQEQSAVAFQNHVAQAPITVSRRRCLNDRFKSAGCTRCVDACPVAAIALESGEPQLNEEQCVQCGACLHACPTDVFVQRKAPETTLEQTLAQLPDQPTALICPRHPRPDASELPVTVVVRHGRCLAALSPADMLALSRNGARPLWLDDTFCSQCPISSVQMQLLRTVEVANRLLSAYGRPASLHLYSIDGHMLPDTAKTPPVLDGMQPRYSRRGLFSILKSAVRERAPETEGEALDGNPSLSLKATERLPQALPKSRRRLLALLAEIAPQANLTPQDDAAGQERLALHNTSFAGITVDPERCSACGLCARFCPTRALALDKDGTRYQLNFRASACIDCDICIKACPEDAITKAGSINPATLISLADAPLVQGEFDVCPGCGAPTAAGQDNVETPLCYACRKSVGTVRPLHDSAGLMKSLLAQMH